MGQTLNGSLDLSSTNGFTPGSCDQTGPGWPANMVGAWATQRQEWIAAMAKRGFPNADPSNLNSLGAPMPAPTNVYKNPGVGMQAINAGKAIVTTKNHDGSTASVNGTVPGSTVVINNPG
jgi:hypothetical protein